MSPPPRSRRTIDRDASGHRGRPGDGPASLAHPRGL